MKMGVVATTMRGPPPGQETEGGRAARMNVVSSARRAPEAVGLGGGKGSARARQTSRGSLANVLLLVQRRDARGLCARWPRSGRAPRCSTGGAPRCSTGGVSSPAGLLPTRGDGACEDAGANRLTCGIDGRFNEGCSLPRWGSSSPSPVPGGRTRTTGRRLLRCPCRNSPCLRRTLLRLSACTAAPVRRLRARRCFPGGRVSRCLPAITRRRASARGS